MDTYEYMQLHQKNLEIQAPATHFQFALLSALTRHKIQQELRSWFEVTAKFSSTTPAAYMIKLVGSLSQSHLDLSDSTMYSGTKGTFRVTLSNFMIQ